MYNAKFVIPGIIVFAGLFTAPFWINMLSSSHEEVKVVLPAEPVTFFGEARSECVEPREWMAANHMELLLEWRDQALREGKRIYVASDPEGQPQKCRIRGRRLRRQEMGNQSAEHLHGLPQQQGRLLRQVPQCQQREPVLLGLPRHPPGEQS